MYHLPFVCPILPQAPAKGKKECVPNSRQTSEVFKTWEVSWPKIWDRLNKKQEALNV
jgi:hypothetical protein